MKDDFFRNDVKGDLHLFVTFHGCVIVKVINLKDKEASIGSRYGDVEQIFFCEAGGISCGDAGEIQFITIHSDMYVMGFCLMKSNFGDELLISHGATV